MTLPSVRVQLGAGDFDQLPRHAGLVAGDEPQAVVAAGDILRAGGSAADAAVTLGLALAVTLPSRAGLAGGGACLAHDARNRTTSVLDFMPGISAENAETRFRAAVPALPRGLFALHARYGRLPWAQTVAPAETLARFGIRVSRALADDIAVQGESLITDPNAISTFMTPRRQMVAAGDLLLQLDLAAILGRMRARGAGDFYAGALARELEEAVAEAGGAVTASDLGAYFPSWLDPSASDEGQGRVYRLPHTLGGAPAAPTDFTNGATTGFVVADSSGNAVACVLTMGRSFGLGIMPSGTGLLLAPGPEAPGVVVQNIPIEIAVGPMDTGWRHVIAGARRNILTCPPGESATPPPCYARSDPRGAGYALTIEPRE